MRVRRCGRVWACIHVGACMDRRALQADRQTDGVARDRIRAPEYREVSGGPARSGLGSATWLSRSPCTRAHVLILARAILTLHNKLCSCCSAAATEAHAAALTLALWLRFHPSSQLEAPESGSSSGTQMVGYLAHSRAPPRTQTRHMHCLKSSVNLSVAAMAGRFQWHPAEGRQERQGRGEREREGPKDDARATSHANTSRFMPSYQRLAPSCTSA
jgi:hypothetical protein